MVNYTFLNEHKQGYTLKVRVIPNSSESKLLLDNNLDCLKIKLNSPPVEGRANRECIKLLSKTFRLSKSSIELIQGEKSKIKVFLIKEKKSDFIENIK